MKETAPVAAVICAAGSSSRMGGIKKEYQRVNNNGKELTVLYSVVSAFAAVPSVQTIVIAIPENEEAFAKEALPPEFLSASVPQIFFVTGGKTRRASVYNALSSLKQSNPCFVLIHDGARPWVTPLLIQKIIEAVNKFDAVIPLLPLTDTPKEYDVFGEPPLIIRHLKRANTGIAQTPQGFKFPQILQAHEKAARIKDEEFTDDAEVWARFCGPVAVIPGEPENKKITFKEDLI